MRSRNCALRCALLAGLATISSSTGFPLRLAATARGEEITLSDGRVLNGRMANLSSVANPLDDTKKKSTDAVGVELIRMIDNDLTRVFVPKRLIQSIDQGVGNPQIEIKIP